MKTKIREGEMVLPRFVYEDLIRDSERARVLESCIEAKAQTPEDFYRCIFGRHTGKLRDDTLYNPVGEDEKDNEDWLSKIFPESPNNTAIIVEKIEDPEDDDFHAAVPDDIHHSDSTPPEESPKDTSKGAGCVGTGKNRKKIDRGKVMALHNAGWKNVKIAEEMGCGEWSVSMIIKEESK